MIVNKGPLPFTPPKKSREYPFAEMELGDWVIAEGLIEAEAIQNAGYYYGKKTGTGFRISRRKDPYKEDIFYLMRVK